MSIDADVAEFAKLREKRLHNLFGLLDLDNDKNITIEEYKELLAGMKPENDEEDDRSISDQLKKMYSKLDSDDDGDIEVDEFAYFYMVRTSLLRLPTVSSIIHDDTGGCQKMYPDHTGTNWKQINKFENGYDKLQDAAKTVLIRFHARHTNLVYMIHH